MSSAWKIQGLRGQSEEEVPFILIPKSRGLVLSVTRPQGLLANYVSRKQLTFRIGLLSSKEKEKLKKLSVLFNRVAGQARQRKCMNSCVGNVSALATPVATFSWAISAFVRASILHEQGPVRVRRAPVHSSVDTHHLILLGADLCNQKAESVHSHCNCIKRAQYDRTSSVKTTRLHVWPNL